MNKFLVMVSDQMNIRWAWEKVRRASRPGDTWVDEIDLAGFELELEKNLTSIAREFKKGSYRLAPLRPLPFPKHPDPKTGKERVRQSFNVTIRDQVAWTAIVNVVGPYVDRKMPTWSYGNRLYRSIWVDKDEEGKRHRKIGNYRHASGQIYLPFGQSWPIFRRHIYLATRKMSGSKSLPAPDDSVEEEEQLQLSLKADYRCPFVVADYWKNKRPKKKIDDLYWCSIDLEKFYPSIKLDVIHQNIVEYLPSEWKVDATELLKSMLRFRLDVDGWSDKDLKMIDLRPRAKRFNHIPTGLYVSGFLANAGLIKLDENVEQCLKSRKVAHFRFVDDHIILAYSFDELQEWVLAYKKLLEESGTGVKFNVDKTEPEGFGPYLAAVEKELTASTIRERKEIAVKDCKLDPKFPSPLMTKTLALVSAIARTDFNLLEVNELSALADQLEHLLLVDLPEEEMPAKTRVSFAAGRLTKVAECRLANPVDGTAERLELERISFELNRERNKGEVELSEDERKSLHARAKLCRELILKNAEELEKEVLRAYQLLQKVLRDRPDRTRLWTKAVLFVRMTGVDALMDILKDMQRVGEKNPLSAKYLLANLSSVLGSQVLDAARSMKGGSSARWQRQAAEDFIQHVIALVPHLRKELDLNTWYHAVSWNQLCLGIHCARLILWERNDRVSDDITRVAEQCVSDGFSYHGVAWAWWSARVSLNTLTPTAEDYVKKIGVMLEPCMESVAFWKFFPKDVPEVYLSYLAESAGSHEISRWRQGWWFDAVINRSPEQRKSAPAKIRNILSEERKQKVTFYQWCSFIAEKQARNEADPRLGEWTVLEIVRQVCDLLNTRPNVFGAEYIKHLKSGATDSPWLHPANFLISRNWLDESKHLRWQSWKDLIESEKVEFRPSSDRIVDFRYSPLKGGSSFLFSEVNIVRGLGLLLHGLLAKSFDLPALWNGPGHTEILGMLPKILLGDITCSSWTLGVLQGCLSPRVHENRQMKYTKSCFELDDDTVKDPMLFRDHLSVRAAIVKCQTVLEEYQLSTLNHNARQLIPINIQQLTGSNWKKEFSS